MNSLPISLVQTLIVSFIYCLFLLIPGYLFALGAGIRHHKFLFSYSFSFSLVVLSYYVFLLFGGKTILGWIWFLHILIVTTPIFGHFSKRLFFSPYIHKTTFRFSANLSITAILLSITIYHVVVGPYTEIPSDFWEHLARVTNVTTQLTHGYIPGHSTGLYLRIGIENPIYFFHALVALLFQVQPLDLVSGVTLATTTLFLSSVYYFSLAVLKPLSLSNHQNYLVGALAVVLTMVTFGTATFSYVRYYSYFPTIFAFPLVFYSVVIVNDYLTESSFKPWRLFIFPLMLASMLLTHLQEAAFSVCLVAGIIVLRTVRTFTKRSDDSLLCRRARFLCCVISLMGISFLIYSLSANEIRNWRQTPHVIDLGTLTPYLQDLPVVNPGFRFWDTLGWFGVIVYIWFIFRLKVFQNLDYINFAMMLPLLTIFNPLYAFIFLHIADPPILWRVSYLMPLSLVASILIVTTFSNIRRHISAKAGLGLVATFLLLASTLPIHFLGYFNRTSRFPSLYSIDLSAGATLWKDLIDKVSLLESTHEIRDIITDSTTRFVLYSAVRGQGHRDAQYFPANNSHYINDFTESDFTHHLLIINRRDGLITDSAAFANHWPKTSLSVSRAYPDKLDTFVSGHPGRFSLVWEMERIKLFQIEY